MRALLLAVLTVLGAGFIPDSGSPAVRTAPELAQLVRELESALDAPGWDANRWSVLVVSLDRGDTLFARNARRVRAPASNLKLFTTAAALYYLGPDYRYPTFLTATGPVRDSVVDGDLLVYGTGDPTLSARFFETRTGVWEALADSLAVLGITRIRGDLVGDASYFEGTWVGRGWNMAYVTHTYAAPATALAYNDNVVTLRVTPADSVGAVPTIQLIPDGSVDLRIEATTTASGPSRIRVDRNDYFAPIVVRGAIRRGAAAQWRAVTVKDPGRFAVSALANVLEARGIRVDGRIRSEYDAAASPVTGQKVFAPATDEDPEIQVLAVHRSPPLTEILKVINQRSHNLYADAVLRTVGRVATDHGSVEGGEAAVAALLQEAGKAGDLVEMDDGSGLSMLDRASAQSIVELLSFMAASPFADEYMQTLPEAATSRGLRRMHRTPAAGNLRAKTGTIERVSALSGYVHARNGELLAFSILSNGVPSTWMAKRVEDRIGVSLASFDRPVNHAPAARTDAPPATLPPGRADSVLAAREAARLDRDDADETRSRYYTIKRGDTLEGIARELGVSVGALEEANPGVDPRRLLPGTLLVIPPPRSGNGP